MKIILLVTLIAFLFTTPPVKAQEKTVPRLNVESNYDVAKKQTTVKFPRIQLGGENGPYDGLFAVISYTYPGETKRKPEFLTFELQTIVKARKLRVDLHVRLLIDGEKLHLSSNRWAEMNVVPERSWISEHIALRMPYLTFLRITKAKSFAVLLDSIQYSVAENDVQMLRRFEDYITEK
ncbi:MAG TPA: hypothetical protein VIV66_05095 [Pyrinomonadaceae bacterium]